MIAAVLLNASPTKTGAGGRIREWGWAAIQAETLAVLEKHEGYKTKKEALEVAVACARYRGWDWVIFEHRKGS